MAVPNMDVGHTALDIEGATRNLIRERPLAGGIARHRGCKPLDDVWDWGSRCGLDTDYDKLGPVSWVLHCVDGLARHFLACREPVVEVMSRHLLR